FEAETLTPTYRLLKGVPGRSYGLAIARRLGIAPEVLALAERAVPEAERALDALLAAVEARARELEAREQELATRDAALREDATRVDARADQVAQREREVNARAQTLEREAREQTRACPADHPTAAVATAEISLRGLRVDEAEAQLVKALDDAVLADLPYLRVIHGKGTGALRQLVHDILSADRRVQRFGFAPPNQGGHGVTIAELTACA